MRTSRLLCPALVLVPALVLGLAGCTSSDAGGTGQIVLADAVELGGYNPLDGYGTLGVSPLYEGLLRPSAADSSRVPDLVPALASEPPRAVSPGVWRLPLREDVRFSDGSALDSADVVATYRALTDPAVASSVSAAIGPISEVAAEGPHAVTVHVTGEADPSPYLLLGIVPSEKVENRPAADWDIGRHPVGTGPYRLESLQPDQAVFVAREDYWGSAPALKKVVYTYTPDDNARAQRIVSGEVSGANLPPKLANSLADRSGVTVVDADSADWRSVSLPSQNAFTADVAARLAMNLAVDRRALVDDVLGGRGAPAATPISAVYGENYEPAAQFTVDVARAGTILDRAGWVRGPSGVRRRGGDKAEFTLLYPADDTLRRDLAVAFAAAVKRVGISVDPHGASWDETESRLADDAVLLAGGEFLYRIDSQVYSALHTRTPGASPFSNPGDFGSPEMDRLLEQARASAPGPANEARYREIQRLYREVPSSVFLAFVHHTYAVRDDGWRYDPPVLEPHAHGVVWGPWWNLPSWRR
ncbi:ABC transporter substrate-binding protein [Gordonia sp. PS3]|nr:ABC transporter substrate-binding protein [Gordonia sihwensis]KJR08770.1 ABC transporter substrate-binding protein [Gordonia sihwensis]